MSIAPDRYCPYITRKQKTQKDKQFKISKHKGYTKMIKNCPHLSISNNSNRCPFCITEINACGQMWSSGITQITNILHINLSKILQTPLNFSYQISIFFIIFKHKNPLFKELKDIILVRIIPFFPYNGIFRSSCIEN